MTASTGGLDSRLPAHLPMLDGLRGLAILLVLGHNLSVLDDASGLAGKLAEFAFDVGWVGVQLFFVLSGFLITGILLRSKDSPAYFRSFFGRRILRIFPLYYAALLLFMVVLPALVPLPAGFEKDRAHQVWLWLYLSNWTQPYGLAGNALPHFWSLAVEEQFYLVWPFLVHRRTGRKLLGVCLSLAVLGLAVRTAMVWGGVLPDAIYTFSVSRIDALALGAAAAALVRLPGWLPRLVAARRRLWAVAGALGLVGLLVTRGYPRLLPLGQTLGYSILAVVFALVVLAAACEDVGAAPLRGLRVTLGNAPLRMLGKYSYAMYVFHKPLHDLVGRPFLRTLGVHRNASIPVALVYLGASTLLTLGVAVASYHLLEKHFLALKPRISA